MSNFHGNLPESNLCKSLKTHSRVWENFWQLKALEKWWKMLCFFSSLRYLHFCPDFLDMFKNGLIRKLCLISKFMTPQAEKQIISIRILPNVSRSRGNLAMKFVQLIKYSMKKFFLKKHAENEIWRLVPDLFLFFKKALYKVKASS